MYIHIYIYIYRLCAQVCVAQLAGRRSHAGCTSSTLTVAMILSNQRGVCNIWILRGFWGAIQGPGCWLLGCWRFEADRLPSACGPEATLELRAFDA